MGEEYQRSSNILSVVENRGSLLFGTDFSLGRNWEAGGTGSDYITELSQAHRFQNLNSLYLTTRYTSKAANDNVTATFYYPRQLNTTIQVSMQYYQPSTADQKQLELYQIFYDGTTQHVAKILVDAQNNKLQYLNSSNTFTDVTSGAISINTSSWNFIQYSVDLTNKKYKSLLYNSQSFDLSSLAYYSAASGTTDLNYLEILLTAQNGNQPEIYISNIVIEKI